MRKTEVARAIFLRELPKKPDQDSTVVKASGEKPAPKEPTHEAFFVYDGEEGAEFRSTGKIPRERVFVAMAEPEKHAFVQRANGYLTPFGAMEMRANLAALGWDFRELSKRCGVPAGACRDALLMTSMASRTYPKMLAAVRLGLHAKALMDARKKAA